MLHEFITGLIPIIFIVLSLIFVFTFQKSPIKAVSNDENELIRYISLGSKIVLKRFFNFALITLFCFLCFIAIANFLDPIPIKQFLITVIAAISSGAVGWLGLNLSISSIRQLIHHSKDELTNLVDVFQKRSQIILIIVLSLALLDLSIWYFIFDFLISINLVGFGEFCANYFNFEWSDSINHNVDYVNRKHLFVAIFMTAYALGSVVQVLLAKLNLNLFATAFDSSADIIGYSEYDLTEDDLKNPASIPDQIGDQLKGCYVMLSEKFSSIIFLIISVSIVGGVVGVIEHSFQSMALIELPIILISMGMFFTTVSQYAIQKFKPKLMTYFLQKLTVQLLVTLFISSICFYLERINVMPSHIFWSIFIGLISGITLFCCIQLLLGQESFSIKFVKENSHHSIIGSISSGFFVGFIATFVISVLLLIIFGISFSMTGHDVHVVMDLYHIGIIAIGITIISLSVFSDSISHSMADNALGISDMLSKPKETILKLRYLNLIGSSAVLFFKVINIIIVLIASIIYLLPLMLRSMKWLSDFNTLGLKTRHEIMINYDSIFDISYDIHQFIVPFDIHFLNPMFTTGMVVGSSFILGICAIVMIVLSKNHSRISALIHDEFKSSPDIWKNTVFPDYLKLVRNLSKNTSKMMSIAFLVMVFFAALFFGLLGVAGTIGFLISLIVTGILLTLFFVITGSILSSSKQSIEITDPDNETPSYVSLFFSDKFGDLLKDSLSPIIISVIKFIILLAILFIGVVLEIHEVFFII